MALVQFGQFPHTATYWGNPTPDGSGGSSFDTPVTLSVRWEERIEETVDENGEVFVSSARVYLDGTDVDLGGYLYLGTSVVADPTDVEGAYRIRNYSKIPTLKDISAERKAIL